MPHGILGRIISVKIGHKSTMHRVSKITSCVMFLIDTSKKKRPRNKAAICKPAINATFAVFGNRSNLNKWFFLLICTRSRSLLFSSSPDCFDVVGLGLDLDLAVFEMKNLLNKILSLNVHKNKYEEGVKDLDLEFGLRLDLESESVLSFELEKREIISSSRKPISLARCWISRSFETSFSFGGVHCFFISSLSIVSDTVINYFGDISALNTRPLKQYADACSPTGVYLLCLCVCLPV